MSVDLEALVRQLEADPSHAVALRRALFGDVPDVSAALERLAGSVTDLATEVRQLAVRQQATEESLRQLAVRQQATEESLRQLADTVRGLVDKMGKHDGWWLEDRHRQKGHAYFQRIARRLHVMTPQTLADVVDDAEQAGTLTEREGDLLGWTDSIFTGRLREGGEPVHLLVESSVTIDHGDLRRAVERAELLSRVVDGTVLPVAAGEYAPWPVLERAKELGAWVVANGRTQGPEDDLPER